jgi:hypothetical protein
MRGDSVVPRGRKAVAALVLVFVVTAMVAVLTPTPAEAQTRCGLEFWYYSDATYTELVGIRGWWPWACGCGTYGAGEITPYREIFDNYC